MQDVFNRCCCVGFFVVSPPHFGTVAFLFLLGSGAMGAWGELGCPVGFSTPGDEHSTTGTGLPMGPRG